MDDNPSELFDQNYFKSHCGTIEYKRSPEFTTFFGNIAERLTRDFAPKTALDAGCAIGILVEELRNRDVDAHGFDISNWAIQQMPQKYAQFVRVGSITDPHVVHGPFDIVTCIEVVEHLPPQDADQAISNLCSWGDLILFSSSPLDYSESTHFNVQQPGYWCEKFARNGFVHVLDYDISYVTSWAMLFRRERAILPSIVRGYEDRLWQIKKENADLRQALLGYEDSPGLIHHTRALQRTKAWKVVNKYWRLKYSLTSKARTLTRRS